LFVQDANARIAHVVVDLIKVVVKPVLLLLRILQKLLREVYCNLTGIGDDRDIFEPIQQQDLDKAWASQFQVGRSSRPPESVGQNEG
jgi:hypothetical protein